ncbi:MAG: Maf family protein, partial [Coxiellaceae bacterium]|nr:Maf family protein [Coxiellaceae bacterium]
MTHQQLILASTSERRKALLTQVGIAFESVAIDIDESRLPNEPPIIMVERLAREKAKAGRILSANKDAPVLAADTI